MNNPEKTERDSSFESMFSFAQSVREAVLNLSLEYRCTEEPLSIDFVLCLFVAGMTDEHLLQRANDFHNFVGSDQFSKDRFKIKRAENLFIEDCLFINEGLQNLAKKRQLIAVELKN